VSNQSYILTSDALTVFHNGVVMTAARETPNAAKALEHIRANDFDGAIEAMRPLRKLATILSSAFNTITFDGENLWYQGNPVGDFITQRAIELYSQDLPIQPLMNFVERVYGNPSASSREELFGFLEVGNLPITPDGKFLAYKRVRDDYKDVHSRSIDNSVGQVVEMPRSAVDGNRDNVCSTGLHFCSREYIRSFSGERLMVLEIDPADVVSIPSDYNNTKGRCCRYKVVGELDLNDDEKAWLEGAYNAEYAYDLDEEYEEETEEEEIEEAMDQIDRAWQAMRPYINDVVDDRRTSFWG
jgi:hypothetical protein